MINQINITQYKNLKFVGDIHGMLSTLDYDMHTVRKYKNTAVIVCGDIGLGFRSFNKEKELLSVVEKSLTKHNNCIVLYRGNHDDPYWFNLDSSIKHDIDELYPHIKISPDYSILNTVDGNILVIGGARSIDRVNRIPNISYWKDEMITDMPECYIDELKNNNIDINIICTHTAPLFCPPYNPSPIEQGDAVESWAFYDKTLKDDNWKERQYLTNLYDKIKKHFSISHWIYGHFHNHFEIKYHKMLCIGLDCCYNKKTYESYNSQTMKYLDDWFWISSKNKGKKGNIYKK